MPFSYDDAGNLGEQRLESSSVSRQYTHDAWNRLVEVKNDNGTSGTTADDFTIARYSYNGLHWRVLKRADVRAVQTAPTGGSDSTNRRELMVYDASWRLVHREIEENFDPAAAPAAWAPDAAEELFWGARYIDDAVARRRTTEISGVEPFNATWADPQWYLTDAQFSVVALVDSAAKEVERVRYDPYGNAQQMYPGDFNGNGQVSVQDIFDWLAAFQAPTPKPLMADFNRDGSVTTQDHFDFLAAYYGPGPDVPEGGVSSADYANGGTDNIIGYCGYVFNHETSEYTVRFRHYSPRLGRWVERDPSGLCEGSNLFEYGSSRACDIVDPSGLAILFTNNLNTAEKRRVNASLKRLRSLLGHIRPAMQELIDNLTPCVRNAIGSQLTDFLNELDIVLDALDPNNLRVIVYLRQGSLGDDNKTSEALTDNGTLGAIFRRWWTVIAGRTSTTTTINNGPDNDWHDWDDDLLDKVLLHELFRTGEYGTGLGDQGDSTTITNPYKVEQLLHVPLEEWPQLKSQLDKAKKACEQCGDDSK